MLQKEHPKSVAYLDPTFLPKIMSRGYKSVKQKKVR